MRSGWILPLLAACDAGERKPPAPKPLRDDAGVVSDAAQDVSLATAPKWIGRRVTVGVGLIHQELETYTLQRDHDGHALLTVEIRRAPRPLSDGAEPANWTLVSSSKHAGTIDEQGNVVRIAVASGGRAFDLTCKRATVAAARADAVRGRTPKWRGDDCEDPGRWVPAQTQPVDVIRCIPYDERADDPSHEAWDKLAFAAAPGIESVYVHDDCVLRGGGWRLVPADGSIAKLRESD